jgi:hypothetical protein
MEKSHEQGVTLEKFIGRSRHNKWPKRTEENATFNENIF